MVRWFWFLLALLGVALAILIARHDEGFVAGMPSNDFAALTLRIGFLILISGAVIVVFRQGLARALVSVLIWAAIGLFLMIGYTYRFELNDIFDRVMAELVPGRVAHRSQRVVEISRSNANEFGVSAQINGARIPMALDTGASAVVLTQEAAKAAGLPLEVLSYNVTVDTANGRTRAASVTLDRIGVGGIVERSVPALIAQPGQLRTSLLGMTYLNRLQSWEVRGDKLIMRGYP